MPLRNGHNVTIRHVHTGINFNATCMAMRQVIHSGDGRPFRISYEMRLMTPVCPEVHHAHIIAWRFENLATVFLDGDVTPFVVISDDAQTALLARCTLPYLNPIFQAILRSNEEVRDHGGPLGDDRIRPIGIGTGDPLAPPRPRAIPPVIPWGEDVPGLRSLRWYVPSYDDVQWHQFRITRNNADVIIEPHRHPAGSIQFYGSDGNMYGNGYQAGFTHLIGDGRTIFRDTYGINWARIAAPMRGGVGEAKPQKTLVNKKYKNKEPVQIREPKNYDGKKYIA